MNELTNSNSNIFAIVDKMVSSGNADMNAIKQLLDMQERIMQKQSEIEFNNAFAEMSKEIPIIAHSKSAYSTTYTPLQDIIYIVRPIMSKYGFSVLFENTQSEDLKTINVTCVLMHSMGFSRTTSIRLPCEASSKGMNAMQAIGAAVTYGKRYALCEILNIATAQDDNNGFAQKPDTRKPITNERLKGALEAIANGTYTLDKLHATFILDNDQLELLNAK